MSALDAPESAGKDFAGDIYFVYHGQVGFFKETGGHLELNSLKTLEATGREARHVRYHNGVASIQRGAEIWEMDEQGDWVRALSFPGRFSDFAPTFDGRWVLFNTLDPISGRSAEALVTDGTNGGAHVLIPWSETEVSSQHRSEFSLFFNISNLVLPYEEFIVIYGQVSGRLRVVDPIKGTVRDIPLPWSGPSGEDPDRNRDAIEARVPKRIQVVPAPGNELLFVWDRNLVGVTSLTAALSVETPRARDYHALAVNLNTGDKRNIEVPNGLEFPLYSPDGFTLQSLAEAMAAFHSTPAPAPAPAPALDGSAKLQQPSPPAASPTPTPPTTASVK